MNCNFDFLKKIDNNLFDIIFEAEKLYRDEYFEQCMVQTRKFGEQICKNILIQNGKSIGSFDEMIETLKYHSQGSVQEKEFIDDLYFLKKNGNISAHSGKIKNAGMTALECLKRSFETAISYSVYNQGATSNILKSEYDINLLVTNKKSKPYLTQKYEKIQRVEQKKINTSKKNETKVDIKKEHKFFSNVSIFWKIVGVLSLFSVLIILVFCVWILLSKIF